MDDATEGAVLHRRCGTLDHIERGPCPAERVLGGGRLSERGVQMHKELCSQVRGCVIRLAARDPVAELAEALGENAG